MPKQDYTSLTNELEKNEQLCISLKSLVDSGCSKESLSTVVEELCDRAEYIKNQYGSFN